MSRLLLSFLLAMFCSSPALAVVPMRYIHPPPESTIDRRGDYYWDLLQAALDATSKTYGPYVLETAMVTMNAKRSDKSLGMGEAITVKMTTGTLEREKSFFPIRIPLDKGLSGYRLFLIHADNQAKFDKIRTVDDLKPFSMGQSANWIDMDILKTAGFKVVTGNTYDGLFRMVMAGRFDLFPRGINEIAPELADFAGTMPKLAIEKKLMLYYPLPRYFFFPRTVEGKALAKRAEEGLRHLIKIGEFDRRYQVFKKQMLAGIDLSGRRVFKINNPFLSTDTPVTHPDLWDSLEKEIKN